MKKEGCPPGFVDMQGKCEPNIVPARNIDGVTLDREQNVFLVPLIPLNKDTTAAHATIAHDLYEYGVPWSYLKQRYSLPKEWTRERVKNYISQHGRYVFHEGLKQTAYRPVVHTPQKYDPVKRAINSFRNKEREYDEIERQIEELKKQKDEKRPYWVDNVVHPIARAMLKQLPDYDRYEVIGPFGLGAEVSIRFRKKGFVKDPKDWTENYKNGNTLSLTVTPYFEGTDFQIYVKDHTTNTGRYAKGTIGEMNGGNYPDVPAQNSLDWFIQMLEKQNRDRLEGKRLHTIEQDTQVPFRIGGITE